jgi:hypothetical protein
MIDLYEKKLKIKVAVADPMTSPKKTNDPKAPIYTSIMPRSLLIAVMADGNAPWSKFINPLNIKINEPIPIMCQFYIPSISNASLDIF